MRSGGGRWLPGGSSSASPAATPRLVRRSDLPEEIERRAFEGVLAPAAECVQEGVGVQGVLGQTACLRREPAEPVRSAYVVDGGKDAGEVRHRGDLPNLMSGSRTAIAARSSSAPKSEGHVTSQSAASSCSVRRVSALILASVNRREAFGELSVHHADVRSVEQDDATEGEDGRPAVGVERSADLTVTRCGAAEGSR